MKNTFYFFIIAFLFISCKKEYHVSGRVYNPINNDGLANVKIQFLTSSWDLPGGYKEVASTTTDANGYYDLKYKGVAERVKPQAYGLYLMGNFYDGAYQSAMKLEGGKNLNIDWHAVPYGKLKSNVNNLTCEGSTDLLEIYFEYRLKINNPIFQPGEIYGCFTNSSTSSDIPMGYYDVTWTVTKPSTGTNTFTGEVFVPENGIGEITINY